MISRKAIAAHINECHHLYRVPLFTVQLPKHLEGPPSCLAACFFPSTGHSFSSAIAECREVFKDPQSIIEFNADEAFLDSLLKLKAS